ncbi:MAG TPA: murein biosynthesis integral membrane protein MurJ [Acidimicrobiales bacterium]
MAGDGSAAGRNDGGPAPRRWIEIGTSQPTLPDLDAIPLPRLPGRRTAGRPPASRVPRARPGDPRPGLAGDAAGGVERPDRRPPPRTRGGGRGRERHVPRTTGAIAAVAGISAIGTLLSRVTGMGRTLSTAYALGASGVSDAYNLANTTPNIVYDLILGGVLAGTLVPVFVQALNTPESEGGEAAGWEAISAVCSAIAAVLVAVTVVFLLATPLIIRFYMLTNHSAQVGAERRLATSLLYLFVPQFFLYGMTAVVTAILVARRRYAAPMYTPVLNNVVVIVVLAAFAVVVGTHPTPASVEHDHRALLLLGAGTTAGVAAMALALVPALRHAGARLRFVWDPGHPACRTILRLSGWMAGVVVSNQIAYLVVILLSGGRPGDYSAYSYAYLFMTLPYGVWAVSVMAPMETEVATAWQAGDRDAARRKLVESIWLVMVVIVPAGLGMAVLARPAITLVLQHGALSAHGASATSGALIAMALGLPTFSLYLVLMRAYQALQDTRMMFNVYLVENGLNIVLDVALYHRFGVRGLAAGLSLAYAGGMVVALVNLSRRMGGLGGRRLAAGAVSVLGAAVAAAGAAGAVAWAVGHLPGGSHQIGLALRVVVGVSTGVTVYLLAARTLRFDEVRKLLQLRRSPDPA